MIGIAIALFQGSEKKKLQKYFLSQSWHIFTLSNISTGSLSAALKTYKETNTDNINPAILETLSKSEAFNINLFLESIRLIFLTEPKFDFGTINSWAMQGKIKREHMSYFFSMMPMDTPNMLGIIWLRIKQKFINIISPQQHKENSQTNSENV